MVGAMQLVLKILAPKHQDGEISMFRPRREQNSSWQEIRPTDRLQLQRCDRQQVNDQLDVTRRNLLRRRPRRR